nr:uncharacterized protein LOC108178064 [Oryctolagus cuniculus]
MVQPLATSPSGPRTCSPRWDPGQRGAAPSARSGTLTCPWVASSRDGRGRGGAESRDRQEPSRPCVLTGSCLPHLSPLASGVPGLVFPRLRRALWFSKYIYSPHRIICCALEWRGLRVAFPFSSCPGRNVTGKPNGGQGQFLCRGVGHTVRVYSSPSVQRLSEAGCAGGPSRRLGEAPAHWRTVSHTQTYLPTVLNGVLAFPRMGSIALFVSVLRKNKQKYKVLFHDLRPESVHFRQVHRSLAIGGRGEK